MGFVANGQLAQDRFAKLGALSRNGKATPLQITDGQTCGVGINEVSNLSTAVGKNSRFVFSFEEFAIVDQQPRRHSVAKRL